MLFLPVAKHFLDLIFVYRIANPRKQRKLNPLYGIPLWNQECMYSLISTIYNVNSNEQFGVKWTCSKSFATSHLHMNEHSWSSQTQLLPHIPFG